MNTNLSIIIPARNESLGLQVLLPVLRQQYPDAEIIVVDDGSSDDTASICLTYEVCRHSHPQAMGNGAAIKAGARVATGSVLVFMDGDGQHQPQDIPRLLEKMGQGYEMVVGARSWKSQAGFHRAFANEFYNWLAGWMVGRPVLDLTSGFRAVRADKFRRFIYLLPNGFSYPTTITMSFFRAGYPVAYVPIHAPKRIGQSHVRIVRDGVRFFLIIVKIGTLYSPFKLFLPISLMFFLLGAGYSVYTLMALQRFTNMGAMLMITSLMIFLVGLVSEQINALNFRDSDR